MITLMKNIGIEQAESDLKKGASHILCFHP